MAGKLASYHLMATRAPSKALLYVILCIFRPPFTYLVGSQPIHSMQQTNQNNRCLLLSLLITMGGCSAPEGQEHPYDGGFSDAAQSVGIDGSKLDANPEALLLPPSNASADYQLGEAYPPPEGVLIVARDRSAKTAPDIYNICYINGFQSQPDENEFWLNQHPELILRNDKGEIVIDPDWDEMILDIRTSAKRAMIATIIKEWIDGCANDGFNAIEIDNLDTYSRSGGLISKQNAVAYMRLLANSAHAQGLPIGQKNSAELLSEKAAMATDFAVVEECNRYSECNDFKEAYGDHLIVIEYRKSDFDKGCAEFPGLSIVLRDLQLLSPDARSYVYEGC